MSEENGLEFDKTLYETGLQTIAEREEKQKLYEQWIASSSIASKSEEGSDLQMDQALYEEGKKTIAEREKRERQYEEYVASNLELKTEKDYDMEAEAEIDAKLYEEGLKTVQERENKERMYEGLKTVYERNEKQRMYEEYIASNSGIEDAKTTEGKKYPEYTNKIQQYIWESVMSKYEDESAFEKSTGYSFPEGFTPNKEEVSISMASFSSDSVSSDSSEAFGESIQDVLENFKKSHA